MAYASGLVSVNGTVSNAYPVAATNQTPVTIVLSNVASTANIRTVTTGKTFYLMGLTGNIGGASGTMQLNVSGTPKYSTLMAIPFQPISNTGTTPIAVFTSGQQIDFAVSGGVNYCWFTFWGFEQ
jgi:hypothetical protein